MADELLLQKSLQREKDEISRLQCQLQQQVSGSRSSSSSRQTPQSNMTTATMASPNLKLGQQPNQWDLAEQQRRLLDLQSQQKHFQQQKHQQPTKHQQQPHFQLPTGQILHPADLGTAGHGIAALLSSPAMTTAAAAALAQLLSHRQQQQQALIINEAASFPKMPSPSHVPNSLASQSQLLTASHLDWRFLFSPMGTAAAHNIYNTGAKLPSDSPCPTPAYHYQLAAPKPSNRPLPIFQQQNFDITGNLSRTTVKPQAQTTQVGVDVRPADSTISTTTASAMALNDVTAGSIRKINRTDQSWEKNGHRETDKNIRNNESVSPPSKSSECQKQQNNNNNASGSDSTKSGESSPRSQQKRAVPVFQITPQQLHMLLQPFFRSQQNQQSAKADAMDCVQQSSAGNSVAATPAASRSSSIEDVAVVELTPSSPKKCRSGNNINDLMRKESIEDGEEPEEYVDVVGDGGMARTSFLKVQRKAHIEFYRKLKSFRNRGNELDCQLCFTAVSNTDANVRSHIHGHCKTALFVCKLCQRGFQDQHLVFDHIGKEHPAHKGSPQFIEDRRDMAVLMELLAECFPRILCRARDYLFEAIGRLTAWAECQGHAQLQCRLCPASVPAQKNALYSHLNAHPSYRCKKCKFSCTDERGQLEHQRREHPGVAVAVESGALGLEKSPYCVSLAFDVLLLSLTRCFPLDKISASGLTGGHLANNEVKEEKDSKTTTVTKESMAEDGREKTKKKKRGTKKRKEQEKEEVVIEGSMKKASVVQEEPVKRRGRKRKSVQRQPKMVDGNSSADEEFGGKSQLQEAEDRTWTPQDD